MFNRSRSFLISAAAVVAIGLLATSQGRVSAGTLTWDPSTAGIGSDGTGTWDNITANWSSGSADTTYLPTASTTGTVISGSNSLTVASATNLTVGQAINGNGFASGTTITGISGTTVTLSNSATASESRVSYLFTNPATAFIGKGTGAAGTVTLSGTQSAQNLTFNAPLSGSYTLAGGTLDVEGTITANVNATIASSLGIASTLVAASGKTLTLTGGDTAGGNWQFKGPGTIDLQSGTYTPTIWTATNVTQEGATVNLGGGRIMIAYGGNSIYTINSASAVITQTATSNSDFIARAGSTGVLNLEQGSVSLTSIFQVGGFDNSTNAKGTLNVSGGSLAMGPSGIIYINYAGTSATNAGTFNLSGGKVTAPEISFGNGSTFNAGSAATLNVTGGTLYLGSGGIVENAFGSLNATVSLSGGTVVATANWSSPMAMTLGTTNGNITFQTADAANVAHNITLSGGLSGAGGLNKTGGGNLTLSGANTYSGATAVAAGTLTIDGTQANGNITIASGATVNGSGTLTFNINNDIADLITDSGSLDIGGLKLALNLTGTQTLRQYVLANCTGGSYSGTFANFTAPVGWSINYTGTPNEILLVNSASVPEPATLGLVTIGAMGLLLIGRRRKTA